MLSNAQAAQVAVLWEQLRFWSISAASDEDVLDGTTFVLEAAERGRYHIAHRDDPEWGDTFGEFCNLLVRLADFILR